MPESSEKSKDKKEDPNNTDKIIRNVVYFLIWVSPLILILFLWMATIFTTGNLELLLKIIILILIIFFPMVFTMAAINTYLTYKRVSFILNQESTVIEIKIPKNVNKPLIAMELLLESFHQPGGEGGLIDKWRNGKTRPWFSLEMVSFEGEIRFFIWMRKEWRRHIESAVYSQYPDAEIYEVEDYVKYIPFDLNKYIYWGCEFKLTKPDPYPIKTYVDYGLDKETKEEYVVDPINSILEFLASVNKGEYVWIQIMARAHKKEKKKPGTFFKKVDWKEEGEQIIKKIKKDNAPSGSMDNSENPPLNLTSWQAETLRSIERNINKHAFDIGIRSIYIADKKYFNPISISGLVGVFKQFSSENLNGFAPTGGHTAPIYPWQDIKQKKTNKISWNIYNAYRWRSYFHPPYKSPYSVLSTEELATIFHIPGESAMAPTLPRITSRKGDAPSNLPI